MHHTGHPQAYESEFGQFINQFKREHPETDRKQREARALWWDQDALDLDDMARAKVSEVKWKPYVYD